MGTTGSQIPHLLSEPVSESGFLCKQISEGSAFINTPLISRAYERCFVWEHLPSNKVLLNVPLVVVIIIHADRNHAP